MFEGGTQLDEVTDLLEATRRVCAELEPNAIGLVDVPKVFDALCETRRLVEGAVTRLTPRFELSQQGRPGVKDPSDATAKKTGQSKAKAKKRARTAKRAEDSASLDRALRDGRLSEDQADTIADAGDLPEDETASLVRHARHATVKDLKEQAAKARARHEDEQARASRVHANRALRTWTGSDGEGHLHLNGPADWIAQINATLAPEIDRAWNNARRLDTREPRDAYAADAFMNLLAGDGDGSSSGQAVRPDRKIIVNVDIDALNRGWTNSDEMCEIAGVGPVSVPVVRSMLAESFLALVFTHGTDIRNVTHLGRQVTAEQRTALEARGYRCANPNCDATHRLEIDHITGWALTHETVLDDLDWLCHPDHQRKTHHAWTLTGPPGNRQFLPPDTNPDPPPRHPEREPRPCQQQPARQPEQADLFST